MKIYVINLARRSDRHAAMSLQLRKLGLSFETITAIDANTVSASWIAQTFTKRGPLGVLPKGDQCCSISHKKAWATFLASGEEHGVFLEDDVLLDSAAATLLSDLSWLPKGVDVMKLEHFGPQSQRVLVGSKTEIGRGRMIAPILSRHTGAAAYILSRKAAEQLMGVKRWSVPVDHLLFNANVSKVAASLKPYQLLPAIARQKQDAASDIRAWRLATNQFSLSLILREIVRAYFEIRLVPKQIAAVLFAQARLVKVANQALDIPVFYPNAPALLAKRNLA